MNSENETRMVAEVLDFYRSKLSTHGPTALGVGWPDGDRQVVMFDQALKVCLNPRSGVRDNHFTLLDYGCGYGALCRHLSANSWQIDRYIGFDLLPEMVVAARELYQDYTNVAEFTDDLTTIAPVDYVVCTGTLNVKQGADPLAWQAHTLKALDQMWCLAKKGLAFNMLTSYSEPDKMRTDLFYADPCLLFDYCKRSYSRQVALLHDYGLWEFTILVRREDAL